MPPKAADVVKLNDDGVYEAVTPRLTKLSRVPTHHRSERFEVVKEKDEQEQAAEQARRDAALRKRREELKQQLKETEAARATKLEEQRAQREREEKARAEAEARQRAARDREREARRKAAEARKAQVEAEAAAKAVRRGEPPRCVDARQSPHAAPQAEEAQRIERERSMQRPAGAVKAAKVKQLHTEAIESRQKQLACVRHALRAAAGAGRFTIVGAAHPAARPRPRGSGRRRRSAHWCSARRVFGTKRRSAVSKVGALAACERLSRSPLVPQTCACERSAFT